MVQPLPSGPPQILLRGGYHARYVAGHIVYIHDGTLFAVPFDLDHLKITGQAVPAIEHIDTQPSSGSAQFEISNKGTFAYLPGTITDAGSSIVWLSRDGKTSPLRPERSVWNNPRFSPDGQKLAIEINDAKGNDLWTYEWARDTLTRLTFDNKENRGPVWTPDGRRIVFVSQRDNAGLNLYWMRSDGGQIERLTESPYIQMPGSWHPSGKYLAYSEQTAKAGADLMILPMEGDEKSGWKPGKPEVFLSTPKNEFQPMFSPDGRWIAYQSDESGVLQVFVRPFHSPGDRQQVTPAGGVDPTWSLTRREILYRSLDNHIMVASYAIEGDSFKAGKPQVWSETPVLALRNRSMDLHSDGERFAAASVSSVAGGVKHDKVVLIFNFYDELRRIAPVSKR
jgi:serine/threonine-protein kinase